MKTLRVSLLLLGCAAAGSLARAADGTGTAPALDPEASTPIGLEIAVPLGASWGNRFAARGQEFRDVDIAVNGVSLTQSIPVGGATVSIGLSTTQYDVKSRKDVPLPLPRHLRAAGIPLAVAVPTSGSWNYLFAVTPGFSSAGNALRGQDFGLNAAGIATCQYSKTLAYSVGVAYDSLATGRFRLFPVAGVNWTPNEQWSIAFGVPHTGVTYQATKALSFGLEVSGEAGTFHVEKDPQPNNSSKPDLSRSKLEFAELRLGFVTTYRFNPRFTLSGTVGEVLASEFKYAKRDYTLKSKRTAPFVAVNLAFSF